MFHRDRPNHQVQRVYAIGDVHGRFDLFRQLLALIRKDHIRRGPAKTKIIVLGDIIDRGPNAARLVHGCMNLSSLNDSFVVLKGNHEEMMVQALNGDLGAYRAWLHFGGRETLKSWNVDPIYTTETPTKADLKAAAKMVGKEVLAWLDDLPLYHRHDDCLFVHAGIRPSVPMRRQNPNDFLWITDDFLSSAVDHGVIVIHGHSITEAGPDVRSNRIGIDTGAYRTDRLTAIGVEQRHTWFLNTASCDDRARIDHLDSSVMSAMTSERDGAEQWL